VISDVDSGMPISNKTISQARVEQQKLQSPAAHKQCLEGLNRKFAVINTVGMGKLTTSCILSATSAKMSSKNFTSPISIVSSHTNHSSVLFFSPTFPSAHP
jgi:hypothetical protein